MIQYYIPRLAFLLSGYGDHRDLHSFPTRRSSDLAPELARPALRARPDRVEQRRHAIHDVEVLGDEPDLEVAPVRDRKSTRLNSSHVEISYAVFCLKKKTKSFDQHDYLCGPFHQTT